MARLEIRGARGHVHELAVDEPHGMHAARVGAGGVEMRDEPRALRHADVEEVEAGVRALRLLVVTAGLAAMLVADAALAQSYPVKAVKLIVTYPPGGSSDLMARILGQKLSELWGHAVVVESKPGAAGSIGMDYAKREPPDGYSFVIGNLGPVTVNPILSKVPYDSERDFVPVSLIVTGPHILG